jgi:CheY-like chemotaxis protein/signal transduction histidine kinase
MMRLTVGKKLFGGIAIILAATVFCCIISVIELRLVLTQTEELYEHPFTVNNAIKDVKIEMLLMSRAMKELIISSSKEDIIHMEKQLSDLDKKIAINLDIASQRYLGDKKHFEAVEESLSQWKQVRDEQISLLKQGNRANAAHISSTTAAHHVEAIQSNIDIMITFADKKAVEFLENSRKLNQSVVIALGICLGLSILAGIVVAVVLGRSISGPISRIVPLAVSIADGIPVKPLDEKRHDDIGQLIESFNRLIESDKAIIDQANAISNGRYDQKVKLRSEKDILGISLAKMTDALQEATERNQESLWFRRGQNELLEAMRGNQDIGILSNAIISRLAHHLDASIGAIYLAAGPDNFALSASYAFSSTRCFGTISIGEGLAGQTLLDRKPIIVKDIPQEYFFVESGVGKASPSSVIIFPLIFHNTVKGVIELGAFRDFTSTDLEFLTQVSESIMIAINASESRGRTETLLELTQQQSEELQSQQEQLHQANEELEEQQEELRQTNEELEEQTRLLEEQKHLLDVRNADLEKARKLLEEKARDLETSGRYKSEFLANMSHELRTPLNSILVLSKLLGENGSHTMTEKQIDFAKTVHASGTELLELINEILDLSKIEAGKMEVRPEEVPLHSVLHRMRSTFDTIASQKGVALGIECDDDVTATLWTDRIRLEQILKNLLSNALKFTERGNVSLRIRRPTIGMTLSRKDLDPSGCVCFVVMDTGVGIAEDKQKVIFEAFQQADGSTSRKFGGTGLGLSISRELARLLGGEILLESAYGTGSTFTLVLPERHVSKVPSPEPINIPAGLKDISPPSPAIKVQKDADPPDYIPEFLPDDRRNITPEDKVLLIIEDDLHFAKILADLANERDFKILVANSGEIGLHFADYFKPSAIILDIGLPGIDGWGVMARLKDNPETRHIPVHFISGSESNLDALRMGAIGFFKKPISLSMIDATFERISKMISRKVRNLLVIDDDRFQRMAIRELIGNGDVLITEAETGAQALEVIKGGSFDCIVLDLGLPDMPGIELLSRIRDSVGMSNLPVIIYTGKELTNQETSIIAQYAEKIIIKGAQSAEKLLDETTLFLHRVEKNLPEDKQRIIRMTHDKGQALSGKKIMIVDDDMRNVYALTGFLEDKGVIVVPAGDGVECVKRLDEHKDTDLILMDIMMPEMDGYETMKVIRNDSRYKDLPIIALTAKAMKGDRDKCIAAGASDYCAKPVETEKLLSMLRVWLYGSK